MLWGLQKEWVQRNKLVLLYQVAVEKLPDLPDVPRLIDLGRNDDQHYSPVNPDFFAQQLSYLGLAKVFTVFIATSKRSRGMSARSLP